MKQGKLKIFKILPLFLVFSFVFFPFFSFSATYISTSQKEVIRDSKRLNDLTIFRAAIESYKTKNGFYPKLETGTNIKGYVASVWDTQWVSFCNLIGLNSCPVDPVNKIIGCDCKIFNVNGTCTGDNINSNIDTTSCYNSKSQSFACAVGSNFYQYQALNNGRNYSLMMEFEYSDNVNWDVASSDSGNYVVIKDTCKVGSVSEFKVLSNAIPRCGDGILNYNEACEIGSKKIEFCKTPENKTGIRYVNCSTSNSCSWDTENVGNCLTVGFCGDGVVQTNKGEECDGGYQKMCYNFNNDSKYNWYNEQLRYCTLGCKWDRALIDSTAYCGGYCGDGIVQVDRGEQCDDSSDEHCGVNNCKYQNSTPVFDFDFYSNRLSSKSYIKSNVWSGDKFQYENNYHGTGTNLIIADKQGSDYVAIWNSDYIEIKIGTTDKEGDGLLYKYDFPVSYNLNFKLKYSKSSDVSKTFHDYVKDSFVDGDIIRMYPTKVNNGKNTYKYFVTDDNNLIFGENYVGYYAMNVVVKENYNDGQNSTINPQGFTASKSIEFKIGAGCGDRILQKELGEVCEFKPSLSISNIFVNWNINKPVTTASDNFCAITVYDSDNAKWNDVSCANEYYGICEKRKEQGCDDSWVIGQNDNCYKLTSKKLNWDNAEKECENNNSKLVVFDNNKEANFLYRVSAFKDQVSLWAGYRKYSNKWTSIRGGSWNSNSNAFGWDVFRDKIFDGSNGLTTTDQYSCGLPWEYDSCGDSKGYCGDNIVDNLFEECDETDKSSYGSGFNSYYQYECKKAILNCSNSQNSSWNKEAGYSCSFVNNLTNNPSQYNCRNSGGYCGDGFFQNVYEHCDSKTRITAADSNSKTFGVNNFNHQYVCNPSDNISKTYKDSNDFSLNKNSDVSAPCRKSSAGFCGDGNVQTFYSKDSDNNYIINSSDVYAQNQPGWKNVAYDGLVNKHYFINPKTYFTTAQEDMFIEECDPTNYTPASTLPKDSLEGQQYGGCGVNDNTSDPCVMIFYTEGTQKGNLKSFSGNCGCRKIKGGYCGNGNIETSFNEECDPELADYSGAKLINGSKSTILENSSASKQYFCGATSKYSENVADLNKYDSAGSVLKTFANIDESDYSCQIFGGYCGDGFVQTDYTKRNLQSDQSYFYSNISTLEQCDPKNHKVVAKDSSSYNSYTCGSANTNKACLNLDYLTKDSVNYGGYCGDGKIQYDLTKIADNQGGVNELVNVVVDVTHPEQCDPKGHYVVPATSTIMNKYDCGVTPDANSCTDILGYCGDNIINSYYNWAGAGPTNVTYSTCVAMDGKAGANNGKWYNAPCDWNTLRYVCEQENPTNTNCISGFIKWSSGNNNCYSISSLPASNFQNTSCPVNTHRVVINSERENHFVGSLVSTVNDLVWIGLNDENVKGQFIWSENIGFAEECDPNSTDYKIGGQGGILVDGAIDSNVNKQYLCGSTAVWSSVSGDVNKYNVDGNINSDFIFSNTNKSNNSCMTFGGYCGDGVVQANYLTKKLQSDQSWFKNNQGTLEQCDPKNHQVSANNSSAINSYTCGSVSAANACVDLIYSQKDLNNNYGGYCGDGKIQYDLTKVADNQDGISEVGVVDIDFHHPEQCDPNGHSVSPLKSSIDNQYSCGANINTNACNDIGGWCGDNVLQTDYSETCDMGVSLLGITDLTNQFCGTCVKFNCSTGSNILLSSVYLVRGNRLISTYTGSFAIMNALSAAMNNDVVFVGDGGFEFSNDYSIDLSNRNITLNSCVSTVWNWK